MVENNCSRKMRDDVSKVGKGAGWPNHNTPDAPPPLTALPTLLNKDSPNAQGPALHYNAITSSRQMYEFMHIVSHACHCNLREHAAVLLESSI